MGCSVSHLIEAPIELCCGYLPTTEPTPSLLLGRSPSSWDYRRVLQGMELGIREAYYEGETVIAITESLTDVCVDLEIETPETLRTELRLLERALDKPVVDYYSLKEIPERDLPYGSLTF